MTLENSVAVLPSTPLALTVEHSGAVLLFFSFAVLEREPGVTLVTTCVNEDESLLPTNSIAADFRKHAFDARLEASQLPDLLSRDA